MQRPFEVHVLVERPLADNLRRRREDHWLVAAPRERRPPRQRLAVPLGSNGQVLRFCGNEFPVDEPVEPLLQARFAAPVDIVDGHIAAHHWIGHDGRPGGVDRVRQDGAGEWVTRHSPRFPPWLRIGDPHLHNLPSDELLARNPRLAGRTGHRRVFHKPLIVAVEVHEWIGEVSFDRGDRLADDKLAFHARDACIHGAGDDLPGW